MSRLQQKCLIASTAFHSLLLLLLVVGPAFLSRPEPTFDLPLLDVIPTKVVDAAMYGGGDPNAKPPPPPPAENPTPVVAPPVAAVKPAPPAPQEPTPKPAPTVEAAPRSAPEITTEKPKVSSSGSSSIKVSKTTVKVKPGAAARTPKPGAEDAVAAQRAASQVASQFSRLTSRLGEALDARTTIGIPGPGGEAFANYGQVVISIYEQAWLKPGGIEDPVTVKATVVIARDGRVLSAQITQPSRNRAVDDSVEQVLERVKSVRPFPEESKDETRTFNLSFELAPAVRG
jgi:TonB family protein